MGDGSTLPEVIKNVESTVDEYVFTNEEKAKNYEKRAEMYYALLSRVYASGNIRGVVRRVLAVAYTALNILFFCLVVSLLLVGKSDLVNSLMDFYNQMGMKEITLAIISLYFLVYLTGEIRK